MKPVDYAVLFGGPALFLVVAYFGLMAVIGPAPRSSAVVKLHNGAVTIGMTAGEVSGKLGEPSSVQAKADGGETYHYLGSALEGGSLVSDEGLVDFDASGRVVGIRYDRSAPPALPVTR
jgi:hypothetical protein